MIHLLGNLILYTYNNILFLFTLAKAYLKFYIRRWNIRRNAKYAFVFFAQVEIDFLPANLQVEFQPFSIK